MMPFGISMNNEELLTWLEGAGYERALLTELFLPGLINSSSHNLPSICMGNFFCCEGQLYACIQDNILPSA